MKKSLLALAVVGFAGAASAQSSVTLFGIVDAGFAYLKASGGESNKGITNSGLSSSRLGFRGEEDLGGGLKAGFWLEGQLFNDSGEGVAGGGGLNFQRRSTVSLMGGFGEVRLGRDYTPIFWNLTVYDPFGTNGVGTSMTPNMTAGIGGTTTNGVRSSNMIEYFTPAMGGFSLQVQLGFGENDAAPAPGDKANNFAGFRAGYAAGPLSAHLAYGKTEGATDAADTKYTNFGASFDLGMVKPMLVIAQEKTGSGVQVRGIEIGAVAPLGQGELRAAYSDYDRKNSSDDWKKLAIGYGYNLSKRTQMYATYARVSNSGAQVKVVSNNGLAAPAVRPGNDSSGMEFGVRHIF